MRDRRERSRERGRYVRAREEKKSQGTVCINLICSQLQLPRSYTPRYAVEFFIVYLLPLDFLLELISEASIKNKVDWNLKKKKNSSVCTALFMVVFFSVFLLSFYLYTFLIFPSTLFSFSIVLLILTVSLLLLLLLLPHSPFGALCYYFYGVLSTLGLFALLF